MKPGGKLSIIIINKQVSIYFILKQDAEIIVLNCGVGYLFIMKQFCDVIIWKAEDGKIRIYVQSIELLNEELVPQHSSTDISKRHLSNLQMKAVYLSW